VSIIIALHFQGPDYIRTVGIIGWALDSSYQYVMPEVSIRYQGTNTKDSPQNETATWLFLEVSRWLSVAALGSRWRFYLISRCGVKKIGVEDIGFSLVRINSDSGVRK
jgi:hypothetical protein